MKRLIDKFGNLIDIPFEPLSEIRNKANIVASLIKVGLLIMLAYSVPGILARGWNSRQIVSMLVFLAAMGLAGWGIKKGYINQISLFLLFSSWVFVLYLFLFLENGLRAPAYSVMIAFLITYAGLLHGRLGAVVITTFTLLINMGIVGAEAQGYYLTTPHIPNAYWSLFGQLIFFSAIAFLVNRTVGNLSYSIVRIKKESDERLKAEMEVRSLNDQLEAAYDTTLLGWSQALELRDKETQGHSQRVTNLTLELSRVMGITGEKELQDIRYGALLHDIGKMGIPDNILRKNGTLTAEEFEIVKQHPVYAYELLKDIKYLKDAVVIPYLHHEKWDGSGYPLGLTGVEIPLAARIFAIADVWDALTSDRPYRKAMSFDEVRIYMQEQSGRHFDPEVVSVFLSKGVVFSNG